jgi:hypothetical protein
MYVAFMTEMLELHRRNTSVGIHMKGNLAGMSAMVHSSLKEISAFIPCTHVGPGKCNVQNEENVLNAVNANPLIIIHWITCKTGLSDCSLA